jgi:hypothetical protein
MIIGAAEPLQVVVTPLAAIDRVGDEVEVIAAVIAGPPESQSNRGHRARIFGNVCAWEDRITRQQIGHGLTKIPQCRIAADSDAGLDDPVLGQRGRHLNAGVGVVVERVCERVHIGVIVRRKLRFDVRVFFATALERNRLAGSERGASGATAGRRANRARATPEGHRLTSPSLAGRFFGFSKVGRTVMCSPVRARSDRTRSEAAPRLRAPSGASGVHHGGADRRRPHNGGLY